MPCTKRQDKYWSLLPIVSYIVDESHKGTDTNGITITSHSQSQSQSQSHSQSQSQSQSQYSYGHYFIICVSYILQGLLQTHNNTTVVHLPTYTQCVLLDQTSLH